MARTSTELIVSCLKNERVIVRHIPRENSMVGNNPKHILYGGMAEGALKRYTVPQLKNGQLNDPLTKAEKDFLEEYMGLEPNALSIFKKNNNFWSNFQVTLQKHDTYLDLSNPDDYIRYKVLLLNKNLIAPDLKTLQDYPKATYEFVLIRESEEESMSQRKISTTKEAYMEYGKIENKASVMRLVIESMTGRAIGESTKLSKLQSSLDELIQNDAKTFLKVVKDPMLDTKVLIREAITAGVIYNRAGSLFLRDDNTPLCDKGEATLSVAAEYLNKPKNQELRLTIEAKVKTYKESKELA